MARQTTLNVSLTPVLRKYVQSKVSSGRYESASEVVRDGLRALQEREQATAFWSDVRDKVAVARRQAEEGRTVDGEAAMDEIIAGLGGVPKPAIIAAPALPAARGTRPCGGRRCSGGLPRGR